jgi:hypothetical protein
MPRPFGGAGSVIGDTTTTMMWIAGVSPLAVVEAYIAAVVAMLIFAVPAAIQQHRYSPIQKDPPKGLRVDPTRVCIVAAILLAPQPGEQSREQLKKYARKTGDNLRDLAGRAEEKWEAAVEKGRQFVQEQKSTLTEAMEAGREAMRRERDRPNG